ncbi:hypothetical protein JZ784_15295 [Acinetobacter sp. CWB-B33]
MYEKKYFIFFILFLCGCFNGYNNLSDLNGNKNKENELNYIKIGDNLEILMERFKGDIIIQNYSDITDLKECQNRKNILVNNTLTSADIDDYGVVTSIHTRDLKVVDANNISVGKLGNSIKKLNRNIKPERFSSGDDSIDLFVYKIPMKENEGYFIYNIGNGSKIESISIESLDHISCNLE